MKNKCQVAILSGGKGTRLRDRSGNLPKPMVPILGKPVLEHQIELCKRFGFEKIALLVHHQSDIINTYFADGAHWGVHLTYVNEEEPRGTAGALAGALDYLEDEFLVLYADTYADINLRKFWQHSQRHSETAGTLLLHPNDHPHDSDLVELDRNGYVLGIRPYPHPEAVCYKNLVNAALYYLRKSGVSSFIPSDGRFDLAKDAFPKMINAGLKFQSYITPEYIKDMGTPDRLDKVEQDIISGLPERLSDRNLRTAIFIDRDGTINREINHLHRPEQLELIPGVGDALRSLNRAGVLAVGVTNQPVLARGDVTWAGLDSIHARLDQLLGQEKAYLDGLYICPHHPDKGFEGEVTGLKVKCNCRKPETGLIDKAVRALSVDRRKSWMVGDATSDIAAGKRAGLRTILVRTGYAGLDGKYEVKPDYVTRDLQAAVDFVLRGHGLIVRQLYDVCSQTAKARLVLVGGCAHSGKSTVASILSEMIGESGRQTHVISLDGWLKPLEHRLENVGVIDRYDMNAVKNLLLPLIGAENRCNVEVPQYERKTRSIQNSVVHSIGSDDLLIIEGVTALMDNIILEHAAVRIYVDVSDEVRVSRLKRDYAWRDEKQADLESRLASREIDEVPLIQASATFATHRVFSY
jgi:histidinol-phosphate phosphatase family protein